MKVNITYPHIEKKKVQRQDIISFARWPFWLAAFICVAVNIATGGPAWALIALWSFWIVWSFVFSPELVEYNRISFWIRFITSSSIMLILIDLLFPTGWSIEVVPIVCFMGLIVAGVLFFTDLDRQKQNMMPMLMLIMLSLLSSLIGMLLWKEESRWALFVLGAIASVLLIACFTALGGGLMRELKKRFHTK